MKGNLSDIEDLTKENKNFRRALNSGAHSQLVVTSLLPGEEIGDEIHSGTDLFFLSSRDGGMPGGNITVFEALPVLGGRLYGAGNAEDGYSVRGAQTTVYELLGIDRAIPEISHSDKSPNLNLDPIIKTFQ